MEIYQNLKKSKNCKEITCGKGPLLYMGPMNCTLLLYSSYAPASITTSLYLSFYLSLSLSLFLSLSFSLFLSLSLSRYIYTYIYIYTYFFIDIYLYIHIYIYKYIFILGARCKVSVDSSRG